jgi:hypothetical protein
MRNVLTAGTAIALIAMMAAPAMAKHSNYYRHYNKYDNHHDNRDNHYGQHDNRYNNNKNDWNWQRTQFRSNWRRLSASRQRQLDAQMRAQWLAYHNNNWNGSYSWNNYSDPAFLDYLHTRNPGLLTTLRTYIGF